MSNWGDKVDLDVIYKELSRQEPRIGRIHLFRFLVHTLNRSLLLLASFDSLLDKDDVAACYIHSLTPS